MGTTRTPAKIDESAAEIDNRIAQRRSPVDRAIGLKNWLFASSKVNGIEL